MRWKADLKNHPIYDYIMLYETPEGYCYLFMVGTDAGHDDWYETLEDGKWAALVKFGIEFADMTEYPDPLPGADVTIAEPTAIIRHKMER